MHVILNPPTFFLLIVFVLFFSNHLEILINKHLYPQGEKKFVIVTSIPQDFTLRHQGIH